jgi:CheY-like chemotaxis protein
MMNKQTILIVDENKELVQSFIENMGEINPNYTVKTASDGKTALQILEGEKIDIVLLDTQIPVMNGIQLLSELKDRWIWVPVVIITDSYTIEKNPKLRDFGIIDFIKKPFFPENIVIRIDDIIKNRDKKDVIKNLGLPPIMQLIEMEKRTGILTMKIGDKNGRFFFKDGKAMDIEIKGLTTGAALEAFINSLYEDREINIEYIDHRKDKKIDMSLLEMVMEASRIKDERKMQPGNDHPGFENGKYLSGLINLLDSFKEVENFIITDTKGEVLASSPENYDKDVLNSNIYLWLIGDTLKNALDCHELHNVIINLKNKKRFIRSYKDYLIILNLAEMTKFSFFKEKLNEEIMKIGG